MKEGAMLQSSPTPIKVVFCTPTITKPYPQYLEAMEASVPALDAAGYEHQIVFETGNPYISGARATMLRKALDAKADVVCFLDHDVSWRPEDLLALLACKAQVAAGTYRFKKSEEEYMGAWFTDLDGRPVVNEDCTIKAKAVPAGFLKVEATAIDKFMEKYPELCYGPRYNPSIDLFNHGALDRVWHGEDFAFSKRWLEIGEIKLLQQLCIDHHSTDTAYPGNLHEWLMRQPGGAKHGD